MSNDDTRKVVEILKDIRVAMVTTHGPDRLYSRPLTVIDVTEDGDLWFFTVTETNLVREIEARSEVNVSFAGNKKWVSVAGSARIVRDVEKKRELWNSMVETFVGEDPEASNVVLVHVDSDSAEYWENPGGAASVVASWVKEKFTDKSAHPGDSGTVDL